MERQGGQTVPVFVQLEFEREQSWHKLGFGKGYSEEMCLKQY